MVTAAQQVNSLLRRQGFLVQSGFAERLLQYAGRQDVQLNIDRFRQLFVRARHRGLGSTPGRPCVALVQAIPIVYRPRRDRVELLGVLPAASASVLPEREQLLAPWQRMLATALAPSRTSAARSGAWTAPGGSSPCGSYHPRCPQPPVIRPVRQLRTPSGATIIDPGFEGRRRFEDPWQGAQMANYQWSDRNLQEALCGRAPWARDGFKVQLHHRLGQPNGPVDEYNRERHRMVHHYDRIEVSRIDRNLWCRQRQRWWVQRALDELQRRGIR
jgi:hypothetical protein